MELKLMILTSIGIKLLINKHKTIFDLHDFDIEDKEEYKGKSKF